eukprot:Nk52_evm5s1524 gene=Nk52_evmTU5s1524
MEYRTYFIFLLATLIFFGCWGSAVAVTITPLGTGAGKALYLDNDFVYVSPFTAFGGTQEVTLEAWVRFSESTKEQSVISYALDKSDNEIWWAGNRQQLCIMGVCGPYSPIGFDGKWHHFAFRADGATGNLDIFLDGKLNQTHTYELSSVPYTFQDGGAFALGQDQDGVLSGLGQELRGYIDEVRIWKIKRTDSEISDSFNTMLKGVETGLVSYWKFDNGLVNSVAGGAAMVTGTPSTISATISGTDPLKATEVFSAASICSDGSDPNTALYVLVEVGKDSQISLLCDTSVAAGVTSIQVTALPGSGTVHQVDANGNKVTTAISVNDVVSNSAFKIIYTPPSAGFTSTQIGVRITPTAGAILSTTVKLELNTPPTLGNSRTVFVNEDNPSTISLSGSDSELSAYEATVLTLPLKGALYQFDYLTGGIGKPITSANTKVTDFGKYVVYVPPSNEQGRQYASFTFSVQETESPYSSSANSQIVNLDLLGVNDIAVVSPTGYCAVLDGVDDIVTSKTASSSSYSNICASIWVKPSTQSSSERILFRTSSFECRVTANSNSSLAGVDCYAGSVKVTASQPMRIEEWSNILVSLTPSTFTIYVNGTISDESNLPGNSSITIGDITLGGPTGSSSGTFLKGSIDDFTIVDAKGSLVSGVVASLSSSFVQKSLNESGYFDTLSTKLIVGWHFNAPGSALCKDVTEPGIACNGGGGSAHQSPTVAVSTLSHHTLYIDAVEEQSTIIVLPAQDVDNATLTLSVTSLPSSGTLLQIDGSPISLTQSKGRHIEQFASSVVRFSAQFTDTKFGSAQILGKPNALLDPNGVTGTYDNTLTWAMSQGTNCVRSNESSLDDDTFYSEFIEIRFAESIFVEEIVIYEINTLGAVVRIKALNSLTLTYETLWTGPPWAGPSAANREFVPEICESKFKTDTIRLELDTCNSTGWNNFDAVLLAGSTDLSVSTVSDPLNRVVYVGGQESKDSFQYIANDCPYRRKTRSLPAEVSINVRQAGDEIPVLIIAIVAGVGSVILWAVAFYLIKRHHDRKRLLSDTIWLISKDDVTGGDWEAKVMLLEGRRKKSTNEDSDLKVITQEDDIESFVSGLLSVGSSSENSKDHVTGSMKKNCTYQGKPVFTRRIQLSRSLNLNQNIVRELNHYHAMKDDNVAAFIGLVVFPMDIIVLTAASVRGTLQDNLYFHGFQLTEPIKMSLISDMVAGIAAFHSSYFELHGNLTSSTCYVDSKWALRVSDPLLPQVQSHDAHKEVENFNQLLYSSPKVLKSYFSPHEKITLAKEDDIWSIGILLMEVSLQKEPYSHIDHEDLEPFLHEMADTYTTNGSDNPLIRPLGDKNLNPFKRLGTVSASQLEMSFHFDRIAKSCLAGSGDKRPPIEKLKKMIARIPRKFKGNLVDNIMAQLERYSRELENRVTERTAQLAEEKKKMSSLLEKMLPVSVAQQLILGNTVEPRLYQSSTIFFSDIVGFTKMCSTSSPFEIVQFLNGIYTMFDTAIESFDAYKVETIGDAYVVVSGVPIENGDRHSSVISSLALALIGSLQSGTIKGPHGEAVYARMGVHTGPVAAGVVGHKMPRYCLFGDSVNTTSRLESSSESNRIHISQAARNALLSNENATNATKFEVQSRGVMELKGLLPMETFWLVSSHTCS